MTAEQTITPIVQGLLPRFAPGFLADHAGQIMTDPSIALVELVANASDAGADRVDITWPNSVPGRMAVEDNGTGMTREEFDHRWLTLSYNRAQEQGEDIHFPARNRMSNRKAFGRNGKGRHAVFCFSDNYFVETWKDGYCSIFEVVRSSGLTPLAVREVRPAHVKPGHGTEISTIVDRNHLPVDVVRTLIGSKFVADPSFSIYVNGEAVLLTDLNELCEMETVSVEGYGTVIVRRFDSTGISRTSKQHGVAWWVNGRLVGDTSWKSLEGAYLDARSSEAKRYTFVAEADILADQVKPDWTDFYSSSKTSAVRQPVERRILEQLQELMQDVRRERKVAILREHKKLLAGLPPISQAQMGKFLDEIQKKCPSMGQAELSTAAAVLAMLEQSRSGYELLDKLANLKPDDLDGLNQVLESWTVHEVQVVLSELDWRLKLIDRLTELIHDSSSDELHDIQPLFERGLWIFGPEYEAVDFMANRTLATIVRAFFKKQGILVTNPRNRPDIVALPDGSISLCSSDSYDNRGEVSGVSKVVIVELKRGGVEITLQEQIQALEYAGQLRTRGVVQPATQIVGFVLGATVAEDAQEEMVKGSTKIYARDYGSVLRQAHARTFHLQRKLAAARSADIRIDPDVLRVLETPDQGVLFDSVL